MGEVKSIKSTIVVNVADPKVKNLLEYTENKRENKTKNVDEERRGDNEKVSER